MMKGLAVDEDNMSTEINASSTPSLYPQHSSTSTKQQPLPRKKRGLPGHPDPEADVIALSPKALLATNRFICEVCNKGFQREQNLQLHRRGHNLPWKLKQTNSKETRKKVYVCPEPTCVHHHPSRALGDLTGIKKHFFRKHGEKKWNCEKCSKRYAVQSDCKAHSKICGTREYKCDCGTLFSRRDSFITHRAFCDALAQETGRAITAMNPLVSSQTPLHSHGLQAPSVKNEIEFNQVIRPEIPQYWWACPPEGEACRVLRTSDFSSPLLPTHLDQPLIHQENPNPTTLLPSFHSFHSASPHTSAAALLHKASSIGVTLGKTALRPHQPPHVPEFTTGHGSSSMASSAALVSGFHMPSREEIGTGFDLASYGNKAGITSDYLEQSLAEAPSLFHDMTGTVSSANGFERPSFEEALRGMFNNATRDSNFQELVSKSTEFQFSKSTKGTANDEMTRDFLGLKAFSPRNIFNMSGLDHWGSSSDGKQNQNQAPWQ